MTHLIRAELRRFMSRRLFRWLGALALLAVVAAAVIGFLQSSKDPEAGLAAARRDVAACEESQTQFRGEQDGGQFFCPKVEELAAQYDKRFIYVDEIPNVSRGIAVVLFIVSFVVGASFMGAEWGSGSMTTLLTWEPRRGRVLAAKAIAGSVMPAIGAALLLAFIAIAFLPVAALRGTIDGLDDSTWWTIAGVWLRGSALAAFGAGVAIGLSTITRNTAGAVGIAFAYGVILDPLLGAVRGGAFVPWLLQHNLPRFIGFADVPQPQPGVSTGFAELQRTLGIARPAILFAVYAAAILALAYATFRARDAT